MSRSAAQTAWHFCMQRKLGKLRPAVVRVSVEARLQDAVVHLEDSLSRDLRKQARALIAAAGRLSALLEAHRPHWPSRACT